MPDPISSGMLRVPFELEPDDRPPLPPGDLLMTVSKSERGLGLTCTSSPCMAYTAANRFWTHRNISLLKPAISGLEKAQVIRTQSHQVSLRQSSAISSCTGMFRPRSSVNLFLTDHSEEAVGPSVFDLSDGNRTTPNLTAEQAGDLYFEKLQCNNFETDFNISSHNSEVKVTKILKATEETRRAAELEVAETETRHQHRLRHEARTGFLLRIDTDTEALSMGDQILIPHLSLSAKSFDGRKDIQVDCPAITVSYQGDQTEIPWA